jgi:hypothetical protein
LGKTTLSKSERKTVLLLAKKLSFILG